MRASIVSCPVAFAFVGPAASEQTNTQLVTQTPSSATCLYGCTSQSYSCQASCISTDNGTPVIPSLTTQGLTNSPSQCQLNCSAQSQSCQQNCARQQ